MLSGGDSAAWFREVCDGRFDDLEQRLAAVDRQPPDALFLPYLKGERCPFHDSKVRGAFLGLDRSHGSAELFYAVLEGVALALRANVDALGIGGGEIRMIGGGAVNSVWPQLIADVAARNVVVTQIPTAATAFGAFSIAAARLGVGLTFADWSRPVSPRADRAERNERRRHLFDDATRIARELGQRLGWFRFVPHRPLWSVWRAVRSARIVAAVAGTRSSPWRSTGRPGVRSPRGAAASTFSAGRHRCSLRAA